MEFWYSLIGVIALIILFPHVRCFFKRLTCMVKIKNICRSKDYKLYPTHKLWYLGGKYGKKCDIYIETPDELLAIKLFNVQRHRTFLIIKENGMFFIRSFFAIPYYISIIVYPIDGRLRKLPAYDFCYLYKQEWNKKKLRKILLINPVPMTIRFVKANEGEYNLNDGDMVLGMEINSLYYLIKYLK